ELAQESELRCIVFAAIRHVHGREYHIAPLCLHDATLHVEGRVAELRFDIEEALAEMQRDARVGAAPMPEHVIVVEAASCRNLCRLCLQLLQTDDIGSVAFEPFAEL